MDDIRLQDNNLKERIYALVFEVLERLGSPVEARVIIQLGAADRECWTNKKFLEVADRIGHNSSEEPYFWRHQVGRKFARNILQAFNSNSEKRGLPRFLVAALLLLDFPDSPSLNFPEFSGLHPSAFISNKSDEPQITITVAKLRLISGKWTGLDVPELVDRLTQGVTQGLGLQLGELRLARGFTTNPARDELLRKLIPRLNEIAPTEVFTFSRCFQQTWPRSHQF
jgi:hypothetical protein